MKTHTQLSEADFAEAVKNSATFKKFETFKKSLTVKRHNMFVLYGKYFQACQYGLDYIKQNPNIMTSEIKLIEEIISR